MRYLHLILIALTFSFQACAFKATKKYHTAPVAAPSVQPVKDSINRAATASAETSRHIRKIGEGADRVDYKGSRALRFFPQSRNQ